MADTLTWSTIAPMPTARDQLAAASDTQGRVYAVGGSGGTAAAQRFDPSTGTWSNLASLPTARFGLAGASDGQGRIYAIGGQSPSALATVERFDPATGTWSALPAMPTARYKLAAATDGDGRVYAVGGSTDVASAKAERFDPATGTWSTLSSLPTARYSLAGASDGQGRIYAIGGSTDFSTSVVERFDPAAGTWSILPAMPAARNSLAAATDIGGRVYAVGGNANGSALATVERFDPATGTWSSATSLATARYNLDATETSSAIYALGGYNAGYLASVEYAPAAPAGPPSASVSLTGAGTLTATVPTGPEPYRDAVLADSPTAYWRMQEASGTSATDATGHANGGTYTGAYTLNQPGPLNSQGGNAVLFSGGDMAVPAAVPDAGTAITIEFWCKRTTTGDGSVAFRWDNGTNRVLSAHLPWSNNSVYFDAGDGSGAYDRVSAAVNYTTTAWNHFAFVKDPATGAMAVYVNGAVLASGTGMTRALGAPTVGHIAGEATDAVNMQGYLAEVAVYPTALSASRISAHYQAGITAPTQQSPTATASLSGSGSLTATGKAAVKGTAALSSSGTLTATGKAAAKATASLSGSGSLSASSAPTLTGTASLSGTGSLTATGAPALAATAALAGTGTLTATGSASQAGSASAALSGAGTLTATATARLAATANLSALGSLAALGVPGFASSVALGGAGSLTATARAVISGTANFSGGGALTASGVVTQARAASVDLTGSGTLTAAAKALLATTADVRTSLTFMVEQARVVSSDARLNFQVRFAAKAGSVDFTFTPPTYDERVQLGGGPVVVMQRGITVLKIGGAYTQVRLPTQDDLAEADVVYLGGHSFVVDQAEADSLVAAGYGALVTENP